MFPILSIIFIAFLTLAYTYYGRWVAKQFQVNDTNITPAHTKKDGVDYIPTNPFYLFGQHFSAIAAAGPIAGPIVACQMFGWVPCLLWIALGVVLIGAVHDFSSLTASVRHGATSIAEVTKSTVGRNAGLAMMAFIWIALIYIIVAFADITAASFTSAVEEIQGIQVDFNPGGAVAAASIMYLALSLILGVVQKFLNPPMWLITIIFVPLAFAASYFGVYVSEYFILTQKSWAILIMVYCAIGSVTPVWALLQPRGFLGGFILYFALAIGLIGLFFGGYEIQQPAFTGVNIGGATGAMFPFLFVTIACGACSGFHGLVCSGTTSKQVDKESHMHPVGYGAMLAEAFVAFIALAVIMMMAPSQITGLKPGTIYGNGIGEFITLIIGKENLPFAITFGAMAFSTFVFDTLDVSTRLGRYILQELTGWKSRSSSIILTIVTVALPGFILFSTEDGAWVKYWTLFGASNQLLAALTLISITMWLYKARKRIAFTLLPMLFVLAVTLTALTELAWTNYQESKGFDAGLLNSIASISLLLLAIYIIILALIDFRKIKRA